MKKTWFRSLRAGLLSAPLVLCTFFSNLSAAPVPGYDPLPKDERKPVLAIGDSMMRILGARFEKQFAKEFKEVGKKEKSATSYSSLGSGLVRDDAFDWYGKIRELLAEVKPQAVIVMLGANDRQTIKDDTGRIFEFGSDEWRGEYAKRVGRAMEELCQDKTVKHVIWMLLPDMKEPIQQDYAKLVNEIIREQAVLNDLRKEKILTFDTRLVVSRKPGKYSDFLMVSTKTGAQSIKVREPDGVHFSRAGAEFLASRVIETFWKDDKKK